MLTRQSLPLVTALCLSVLIAGGLTGCQSKGSDNNKATETSTAEAPATEKPAEAKADAATPAPDPSSIPANKIADAATILARPQVPILCYHQIRDWRPKDSKTAKDYIIPVASFRDQMQMLADSG